MKIAGPNAAKSLIQPPLPVYPPAAKARGIEGTVKLQIQIGTDGRVTECRVLSGNPILVPAAIDAAARYVYKPFLLHGTPVATITTLEIPFGGHP